MNAKTLMILAALLFVGAILIYSISLEAALHAMNEGDLFLANLEAVFVYGPVIGFAMLILSWWCWCLAVKHNAKHESNSDEYTTK